MDGNTNFVTLPKSSYTNTYILNGWLGDIELPMKKPKILECNWAMPRLPKKIKAKMWEWKHGRMLADFSTFPEQVKQCDVLIINGGDSPLLIERLNSVHGWREHLHNKFIFAWSAGISALTAYSWNNDHDMLVKGLGILPFKSIVHYRPYDHYMRQQAMYLELFRTHEQLDMLLVRDDEYYVFER